jgi:hypothetical protein
MSRSELTIRGRLADSVATLIATRFDAVSTHETDALTTLVVDGIDPAAERALLNLLWDTGHDVVGMRSTR